MYIKIMSEANQNDPESASFYEGLIDEITRIGKWWPGKIQQLYQVAGEFEEMGI